MAIATIDCENPSITIANANSAYSEHTFYHDHEKIVRIDASLHEWSNYFKCGYKGIFEKLKVKANKSLFILMDGTVPLVYNIALQLRVEDSLQAQHLFAVQLWVLWRHIRRVLRW
jgi:hypothetical protein